MSETKHNNFLKNHCRVCGKRLGRTNYNCEHFSSMLSILGVNVQHTDDTIHPTQFCNSCYMMAKRVLSGSSTSHTPVVWRSHDDVSCSVCDKKCKGGRHKKISSAGRPSILQVHIQSVATNLCQFKFSDLIDESFIETLKCTFCQHEVIKPVEILPCKTMMCCSCCLDVTAQPCFSCKGCSEKHDVTTNTFSKLSNIAEKMIKNLEVKCNKCSKKTNLEKLQNSCEEHGTCGRLTDLVNMPLEERPTQLEKRVAHNLVKRMLHQSDDESLQLPTGGRVSLIKTIKTVKFIIPIHLVD